MASKNKSSSKRKNFYPQKASRSKIPQSRPNFKHLFAKIKQSDTLHLYGEIKNQKFMNGFFTINTESILKDEKKDQKLKNQSFLSQMYEESKVPESFLALLTLSNKKATFSHLKADSSLLFNKDHKILRMTVNGTGYMNSINGPVSEYKPLKGELGSIITERKDINEILQSEDGKYVRIKRISPGCESVQNIEALQLVVTGWFKGYLQIGKPTEGVFKFKIIKKVENHFEKQKCHQKTTKQSTYFKNIPGNDFSYFLRHDCKLPTCIEGAWFTTENVPENTLVEGRIVSWASGVFKMEKVEAKLDLAVDHW